VYYDEIDDYAKDDEKLHWISTRKVEKIDFKTILPDKHNNWINIPNNDFDSLVPLCKKNVKYGKCGGALFELYSLGVVTARDEWVYDNNKKSLSDKVKFFIDAYNKDLVLHKGKSKKEIAESINYSIKWTRAVKNDLAKGKKYKFNKNDIVESLYRPFVKKHLYFNKELNEMRYLLNSIFHDENVSINFLCVYSSNELATLVSNKIFDYCSLKMGNGGTQCLPLYRYDKDGNRLENITDWGLQQFVKQYNDDTITKQDIFHYVYAVLHNPAYRKKYELNLKRDFPRIPFYDDFRQWATWGKQLMNLHLNYETVEPYQLRVTSHKLQDGAIPKTKLKADKGVGVIFLDDQTELHDIPTEAWNYKLGNRSALEWILDQYQENKPKDPTIAEKFDNYRFADYKEQVIDLLQRVCTVSVETMTITGEMKRYNS
ncbi:MAG: hypothetical protein FWF09_03900, partial [Bacteroidales bacterium]|nr:hypothetical protein [Bacteroidales bacterium]